MALFSKKNYLSVDPVGDLAIVETAASELGHPRDHFMSLFCKEQAGFVIYLSNIHEASIPTSISASEASMILGEAWSTGGDESAAATPWLVEGTEDRTGAAHSWCSTCGRCYTSTDMTEN